MKSVIALQDGFYKGGRIRKGTRFKVEDTTTGKWFVPAKDYVEPAPRPLLQETNLASRRESESFVTRMKQLSNGVIKDEAEPQTMAEVNAKLPQLPEVKPKK